MMMSSNGNSFRVTGPLWGKFTDHRCIPLTKVSDAELWSFLWSVPEKRLIKQSWGWWIEMHQPHYDVTVMCDSNLKNIIFKPILQNRNMGARCVITLWWMQHKLCNEQSTLVQVMTWCRQATSHYLNQCWPRSMTPHGVAWPQCVNNSIINSFLRYRLFYIFGSDINAYSLRILG